MKIIICIILFISSSKIYSQYNLQWYRTYDLPSNMNSDIGEKVIVDDSGYVYITGGDKYQEGDKLTSNDYATIKYSPDGDEEWIRKYNYSDKDFSTIIAMDSEKNIYVTGISDDSSSGGYSIATIKYSAGGDQLWVRRYSAPNYLKNEVTAMIIDSNNNILLSGYSSANNPSWSAVIIKYNSKGDLLWSDKYYSGQNTYSNFNSLSTDSEGNVYTTGRVSIGGSDSLLTIKYNSSGVRQWVKVNSFNIVSIGVDIETDKNGNTYAAVLSRVVGSRYDLILVKYSKSGEIVWSRGQNYYNSFISSSSEKHPKILILDSQDNILLNFDIFRLGEIYTDIVTSKYDSSGNVIWSNIYYSFNNTFLSATDIKIDINDNIYTSGSLANAFGINSYVICKYNSNGTLLSEIKNNNKFNYAFTPLSLSISKNEDIIATGYCTQKTNEFLKDIFTIKYSHTVNIQSIKNSNPSEFTLSQNYPNPFNPATNLEFGMSNLGFVTLKVYDLLGKEVALLVNEKKSAGNYSVTFNGNNLSSGVYFYSLFVNGNAVATKRMLLLK